MKERILIKKCRKGIRSAQREMVDKYSEMLYNVCCRYVLDRDFAKDCLQETWIQIFWNLDKYKEEGKWEGWIRRVAVNKCKEVMRKQKKWISDELEDEYTDKQENCETMIIQAESVSEFMVLLSPRQRLVVNMYLVEEFSHKEIADYLEITESSSRSLLARALKVLRKHFKDPEQKNLDVAEPDDVLRKRLFPKPII